MSFLRRAWIVFDRAARRILLAGVHGYQHSLGYVLGGQCRFVPTCSHYAEEALQRGPLFRALGLIIWRILRCQPLCKGGLDPVPPGDVPREYWLGSNEKKKE